MGNITDERTSESEIEQVKERVQDVAVQAKEKTRFQFEEQVDTRTTDLGEQLSSTARAFRRTGTQLRQEGGNDRAAGVIEAVADRGERLGTYLVGADGQRLLRDVEDFARRQPWLIASAGALTGFLAARFVKASSGNRYQSTRAGDTSYRPAQRPASPSVAGVPPVASTDTMRRDELRRDDLHDRPVGELLKQLANETSTLMKLEVELAKAEMQQKTRKAIPGVAMLAGAGVAALLALGAFTALLILALDGAIPNWAAALIVTVVYVAVAAALYVLGKERVADAGSPAPRQTIETLKEDVEWAKHPTRSATR